MKRILNINTVLLLVVTFILGAMWNQYKHINRETVQMMEHINRVDSLLLECDSLLNSINNNVSDMEGYL